MKKGIALTSLALLLATTVSGCSCGKNGEYHVSHIEYVNEDGETATTDCSSTDELPVTVATFCEVINIDELSKEVAFIVDGSTMTDKDGKNVQYIKVKSKKVLISDTKDGEYVESDLTYSKQTFKRELSTDVYLVFEK